MAAAQLSKDSDKNREKDRKKGMDSVITPDKDQHDTICAMYMFETYTHKHRKHSRRGIRFFHTAAEIT